MDLKMESGSVKQPASRSLANPLHIDREYPEQRMHRRQTVVYGALYTIAFVSFGLVNGAMAPGLLNWCVSSIVGGAIACAAILIGNRLLSRLK